MCGELLAETRKLHHETQKDLAAFLNVSVSTVRSWESGRNEPNYETLRTICLHYRVSSDFLLGLSRVESPDRLTKDDRIMVVQFEEFLRQKH